VPNLLTTFLGMLPRSVQFIRFCEGSWRTEGMAGNLGQRMEMYGNGERIIRPEAPLDNGLFDNSHRQRLIYLNLWSAFIKSVTQPGLSTANPDIESDFLRNSLQSGQSKNPNTPKNKPGLKVVHYSCDFALPDQTNITRIRASKMEN
jgi:hypothetical protein